MATNKNALDAWRNKYVSPVTGGAGSSVGETGLSAGGSALDAWREKYVAPVTTPKETVPVTVAPVEVPPAEESNTSPAVETDAGEERSWLDLQKDAFLYGAGKVGTGILGALEGANDFIGSAFYGAVGGLSDLVGADKLADFSKKKAASYLENSITDDLNQKLEEKFKPTSAMQTAGAINETVSGLLPSIAAGNVVGSAGTGLKAAEQAAKGANVSKALFGLTAAGGSAGEAKREGATLGQAMAYGTAAGLLETTIEGIAGGIPGMGTGKAGEIAAKLTSNPVVAKILDIVGEGGEEALTTFVTPYLKRAMYDENAQNATAEEIAQNAAMGMIASGILQGGLELPGAIGNKGQNKVSGAMPGSGLDGTPTAQDGMLPHAEQPAAQTVPDSVEQTAALPIVDTSGQIEAVEGEKTAPAAVQSQQQNTLPVSDEVRKKERLSTARNMLEYSAYSVDVDDDTVAMAQRLSDATGREILFYRSDKGENGYYSKEDRTIWINANSKNPVAQIIAHELTHSVEFADAYGELSALVQTRIAQTGGDIEQLLQAKKDQYAARSETLDDQGAMQEVVAEYVEKNLLTDEASIMQLGRDNPGVVRSILRWLDGLLARMNRVGKWTGAQERVFLRQAREVYARALQQSNTGYGVSTDTTMQRMGEAYAAEELSEEEFDDAVDMVMEEESTAGKSMVETDPLSRRRAQTLANEANPRRQYSYTDTQEGGAPPVDEGYWNSVMEEGAIPFAEADQPGYSEALLADVDRQNPYAGRMRDVDPSEYTDPDNDTAQRVKKEELPVEIDNLPTKAANVLKRAENAMLRTLGEKLSVPGVAQRDYLKPIVRQISEEYLRTGDISRETADAAFAETWNRGVEVDSEFYEENKHIKDYLRTTKITVGNDIKADFADWNSWRQRAFGSLRLVDSGGIGVDTAYMELNEMNPGLFPDSIIATSDQLQRMYDVATSIRRVETTLEAAHAGDTVFEQWAQQQFEDALAKMRLELRGVKRYTLDRAEQLAKEETSNLTLEDVKELYPKLKDARRQYERAQAKNLLTAGDSAMVNRILRGDAELEGLDPEKYNVSGIRAVYEAKQEYENYASQIRKWNQSRKAGLRNKADTFLRTANAWKDKAKGILYSRETMERNVRDIVPDNQLADQVVREYFTPVHDAVAAATRTKNEYRDRVRALNLSTKISKADAADGKVSEAHAVQLLGEAQDSIRMLERSRGRMKERDGKTLKDWKAVVENLWANNPQLDQAKIEGAVEEFREIYDELFTKMNETRVRNGYEPVNYRSGYFPHFQPGDGDGVLVQFGKALGIDTAVSALPTNINGLSHTFKPGITWMGNAQERLGFNTVYDAVEGFDKYIEGVADVIHLTDSIQNLRAFASQMRYRTTEQGIRDQVDTIRSDERLTAQEKEDAIQNLYNDPKTKYVLGNFVVELDEYINLLANKKSRADRNMEQALGRDAYNAVKALESRVAANMVAVNPASWLTNFIPLTQGWAGVTSKHLLQGMQDTLKSVKADDGIVGQSSFLTNRRGSDPLVQTWAQKASETASKPMEYIDNFTAGSLVRARYYQNLERGMSEAAAMEEADGWVAGVMADRSKGSTPTLFNRSNPITKLFTQFQLEVNNQLGYVFKDIPRDMKDKGVAALAGALLKFALGAFLFDEIYEYFIGRRPALDPIGILNDTVGDLTGYELPNLVEGTVRAAQGGEFFEEGERTGVGQAAGNLMANVAGELPFTSVLSVAGIDIDQGRIPVSSAMPDVSTIGSVFGDSGWSTKKRVKEGLEELAKPATYLALPFGGGQLKKVGQGIYAAAKGGSYTMDAEGNEKLQYPVYNDNAWETTKSLAGSVLFGKSSLPTGREWVENGFPTLSVKETQAYQNMTDAGISGEDAWGWIQLMKEADGTIGKLTAVGESGAPDEAAQELFGVVMGKEMETDAGNPTQYAKMLEAMADGMTAAEYVTYRQAVYKLTKKSEKLEALQAAGFTAAEAERLLNQLG